MKLKRIFAAIVAAAALTATLTACKGDGSGDKVYNIGICQLVEHPALDAATEGFMAALTEKLGEENVDLILANATGALQAAASATNSIPIVGTSITSYAVAMGIDDWADKTFDNVTGTSDLAPIDGQEDMLVEVFPDVKQVGIIYCSAEANSKYQVDLFKAELEADGIAYKEYSVADSNEIQAVATTAVGECDVLYIPTDNTLANAAETIRNVVVPAKIPVIAGEEGICKGCGVATLSISYYDIGYKAGEMAYDILVNGTKAGDMDIAFAPQFVKMYNAEICNELDITPPEGYEAVASEE